jgi:hypothetical protein
MKRLRLRASIGPRVSCLHGIRADDSLSSAHGPLSHANFPALSPILACGRTSACLPKYHSHTCTAARAAGWRRLSRSRHVQRAGSEKKASSSCTTRAVTRVMSTYIIEYPTARMALLARLLCESEFVGACAESAKVWMRLG